MKLGFVDDGGSCNSSERDDGECLAFDDNGHGTQMVGLVGENDNNIDRVGIAPQATVYSMKVAFNAERPGLSCGVFGWGDDDFCVEDDDWVAGIEWASFNDVGVLSMSFVADVSVSVAVALSYAYFTYDVLLVAGLGNNSGDSDEIVKLSYVMGVGGLSDDETLAFTINLQYYEIGGFAGGLTTKALCASASICTYGSPFVGGTGGTSAATANVAAVAGLLRADEPGLSNVAVRNRLKNTASGAEYSMADAEWAVENVSKVSVGTEGPLELNDPGNYSWEAIPTAGLGGYTYVWEYRPDGGSWHQVGTSKTYTRGVEEEDPDFELRVTVSSASRRDRDYTDVLVCMDETCNN